MNSVGKGGEKGGRGEEGAYPKEYRAWTSCLRPVSIPPIPMNAGGMHVSKEKNRITREASRRDMPIPRVASMPVGILWRGRGRYTVSKAAERLGAGLKDGEHLREQT